MTATVLSLLLASGMTAPPVTALAFAPGGESIVVGSQAGVEIRDWPGRRTQSVLETRLSGIHDLSFSPDGTRLVVAGGTPAEDGTLEIFSWPERELTQSVRLHDDVIYAVAWRSDSGVLATAGLDGSVALYDPGEQRTLRTFTGHSRGVLAIEFLSDEHLVSAGIDQTLRVWNPATGELLRTLDNHTRPVADLALRPQQGDDALPMLASVSADRTVRLWQPTIGRLVRFARLERTVPLAVEWTDGGRRLAIACSDGHVRVIDPDTVELVQDLTAIEGWAYSLAVHPSRAELAVGGRGGALAAALPAE